MCNRTATATASTGSTGSIQVLPTLINYGLQLISISDRDISNLGRYNLSPYSLNYHGDWDQDKKEIVEYLCDSRMLHIDHPILNRRDTFRIDINNGSEFFLAEILIDQNSNQIEMNNVGIPSSSLPNATQMVSIQNRLSSKEITLENWDGHPNYLPTILMGLNFLSDGELETVRGLKIAYEHATPIPQQQNGILEAGIYDPNFHIIYIYDSAFRVLIGRHQIYYGIVMGLGGNPARLIPSASITLLHEIGHAISYRQHTILQKAFNDSRDRMRNHWSNYWNERTNAAGHIDYNPMLPSNSHVATEDRAEYSLDYNNFMTKLSQVNSWQINTALQPFLNILPSIGQNRIPFTQYLKDLVTGVLPGSSFNPNEEFFAEGFALYYCDRPWLQNCHPAIHNFFSSGNHLTIS